MLFSSQVYQVEIFHTFQRVGGPFNNIEAEVAYGDYILEPDLEIFRNVCALGAKINCGYGMQEVGC
jgi:hypothetical protein